MKARHWIPVLMLGALAACEGSVTAPTEQLVLESNFQAGTTDGWAVDFADLPTTDLEIYELESGLRSLPAPLDTSRKAIFIAGHNRSDDLFMFMTRRVDGLTPGATYDVRFAIQIATNAGSGCVGIGGAPGESVYLKAGATGVEPAVRVKDDFREVNFDKGQQASGGPSVPVIGDVASGSDDCSGEAPFRLKTLSSGGHQIRATADAGGRLWLVVGTDSGFEGLTRLYYPMIRATLDRL